MDNNFKSPTPWAIALVLVVAIAGALWYYFSSTPSGNMSNDQNTAQLEQANLLITQDQASTSIPILNGILSSDSQQEVKDRATLALAMADFAIGENAQAANLLRTLSLNLNTLPQLRSEAAYLLATNSLLPAEANTDFAINNVFTGPVWGNFLASTTTPSISDIQQAGISALEWASNIYALPQVEYQLALWYAQEAFVTDPRSAAVDLQKAQTYLQAGDTSALGYSPDQIAGLNNAEIDYETAEISRLKAGAQAALYAYNVLYGMPQTNSVQDISSNFERAISTYDKDPGVSGNILEGLYTRFNYAFFLASLDNVTYKTQIQQILAPLDQMNPQNSSPVLSYLVSLQSGPELSKQVIIKMAVADPVFAKLLASLGWSSKELSGN